MVVPTLELFAMFDFNKLPADEQQAIRDELQRRYLKRDGEDIDLAIKRHRRTLKEHDRELEHVSKMDFEKPYRWRVAPGIALRAEKALELQKKKRGELMHEIYLEILRERGHFDVARPVAKESPATVEDVQELTTKLEQAFSAIEEWKWGEGQEASPPNSSAA